MLDARVVAYVSTNGSSVGAAAASVRPFWERPLDGGGALRFGKDSLYHTRLVIIISAPHWIGRRPKKTTLAGSSFRRRVEGRLLRRPRHLFVGRVRAGRESVPTSWRPMDRLFICR